MRKTRIIFLAIRIILFALILSVGTVAALMAGETQGLALTELPGSSIQAVAGNVNDNVLYAGVVNGSQVTGIYRSEDNGRTWRLVNPGLAAPINALAVNPKNSAVLYAGGLGGPVATTNNLWRSKDGGRTWENFTLSLPANPDGQVPAITALAVSPDQPDVLYAGTDGQGVYRFNSRQVGYEMVGDISLRNAQVKSLAMGADSRVYALTNTGLFVASDERWQQLERVPELPVSLAVAPGQPDSLYAGTPSSGVYRSDDGGQTWQAVNDGLGLVPGAALRITAVAVDRQDPQRVVVATAYGLGSQLAPVAVYESQTGGNQWFKVADVNEIVTHLELDQEAVYATSAGGVRTYGQPAEVEAAPVATVVTNRPAPATSPLNLQPLANPNVTQAVILVLTVLLAALVLVGRIEWLADLRQRSRRQKTAA